MKHKISRGVPGRLLAKMKHLKGDIVHYSETVLVETSNILLPTHNIWTLVSRSHLIDYNAAQNLGSKTDFPDLTVVDSSLAPEKDN